MNAREFAIFQERSLKEYAEHIAHADELAFIEAVAMAQNQVRALLPRGRDTPEHFFFRAHSAAIDRSFGDLWLHLQPRKPGPHAFIYDIRVDDDVRRQGIGKRLMQLAEEWAKSQGVFSLKLHVFASNEAALSLYESCGFRSTSSRLVKML